MQEQARSDSRVGLISQPNPDRSRRQFAIGWRRGRIPLRRARPFPREGQIRIVAQLPKPGAMSQEFEKGHSPSYYALLRCATSLGARQFSLLDRCGTPAAPAMLDPTAPGSSASGFRGPIIPRVDSVNLSGPFVVPRLARHGTRDSRRSNGIESDQLVRLWHKPRRNCVKSVNLAGVPGLEPRTKESESSVLPITPYPNAPG